MPNTLYYGDNLSILQEYIDDESIDLVYLDPPFKSNQDYNVLFKEQDGTRAAAQIKAFEDTWTWDEASAHAFQEVVERGGDVSRVMQAFKAFMGGSDMLAYLSMMAPRLIALHSKLKDTGSLYLHCDSTASHYLKILLDTVFGPVNFRNEIIWKRAETVKGNFGQGSKRFDANTDSILFYRKAEGNQFNQSFSEYSEDYVKSFYKYVEKDTGRRYRLISMTGPGGAAKGNPEYEVMGVTRFWRYSRKSMQALIDAGMVVQTSEGSVPQRKQYLDEGKGVAVQSLWDDIPALHATAAERLGYPTQKPEALLERIIQTSSNEGDVVLDPFCGCGTTISASEKLKRQWIGIDITHIAIGLIKHRLQHAYGGKAKYDVIGEPVSLPDAQALAREEPYQFQWWAVGTVGARLTPGEKKKGPDRGIDGRLYFHDDPKTEETKQIILSVKSGHIPANHIRELRGVLEQENAAIAVLLTMEEPSKPMRAAAAEAGFYESPFGAGKKHPRIQIITIEELLDGRRIDYPQSQANVTYKRAKRHRAAPKELPVRLPHTE